MKNNLLSTLAVMIGILAFTILISSYTDPAKPWSVPDAAKSKKNPVASNAESIASGKTLWGTHCKSCHGAKGLGDGPKATTLKTEPGDLSSASFQSQSDGALFYKISEGRDDMPKFKQKIAEEEERWDLVNFMRTLKH